MVKSPLVRVILCLAVLALIGVTALALGTKSNFITTKDGRLAIATKAPSVIIPYDALHDAGLKTIAGNLSTYPYGTFFCCFGNTIAQEGSYGFPFTTWVAIPFTPTANATVTRIEASVGTFENPSEFELSLREDNNGLPGKVLKSVHIKNPSQYGACCTLDVGNDTAGIPVTKGTQYWIAATTRSKDVFEGGWAFNSTDMRSHPIASYCKGSSTYCGTTNNGKWVAGMSGDPLPAYAILGN
ncbi:MAG: choice-of-anchor R domain-containing protein [Terriglobales bacterium]